MALNQIVDSDSVSGYVDKVEYAYGATVPHEFTAITYAGNTPTSATGITFQLLVKASKSDADSAALVNVANAGLTISTSPLVVGYDLNTQATGFLPNTIFHGELWVVDTTYGTNLVKEWQIHLSDPIKNSFP